MSVISLDHLVLRVSSPKAAIDFYTRVLGMHLETFGDGRFALHFGDQKINLHGPNDEILPQARHPKSGSADLCFIVDQSPGDLIRHLEGTGVDVELGPVRRTGANGALMSIYVRDPDGNLIELSSYID